MTRTRLALLAAGLTCAAPLAVPTSPAVAAVPSVRPVPPVTLVPVATLATGGAEIVAYDPKTQRSFVTEASPATLRAVDLATRRVVATVDMRVYGSELTSVDARHGRVVAVVKSATPGADGTLVLLDARTLRVLGTAPVGAGPDAVVLSADGRRAVVANEGEPTGYCATPERTDTDPEGSVSVVDLRTMTSRKATFTGVPIPAGVRIYGPRATPAQDLEPEYVALLPGTLTAVVSLQENNALAYVDLGTATVTKIVAAGYQDHGVIPLDPNDRDATVGASVTAPGLLGMRQPDAVVGFAAGNKRFTIEAGEGDAREYACFDEQSRVGGTGPLARLRTTIAPPTTDKTYAYGSRAFTIRDANGVIVFDSADQLERLTLRDYPELFNASAGASPDSRSDDKGPEPEGAAVGRAFGRTYAAIGLERGPGAIVLADITVPGQTQIVDLAHQDGDLAPEGLEFVSAADSANGVPQVIVANEVSGTVTVYELRRG